jgi:hypothetical protein
VILDFCLAELYGVPTKSLNLAVKRNRSRFPQDFIFQLDSEEYEQVNSVLRFQSEASKKEDVVLGILNSKSSAAMLIPFVYFVSSVG